MKFFTMFALVVWGCLVSGVPVHAESAKGTVPLEITPHQPQPPQIVVVGPLKAVPYQPSAPIVVQVGPPKLIAPDQPPATKEGTLQELKKEVQDLRRRLRELEQRLSEFEKSKQP